MQKLSILNKRVEHLDTDASGVVHFSRYPSLMETAVLENLDNLKIGMHALESEQLDLVVSEMKIKYLSSAYFLDYLLIDIQISHIGTASFKITGEIYRQEQNGEKTLLSSAEMTYVIVNKCSGAVSRMPSYMKNTLKECYV
ncbi:acyl-CoA thioesterase [Bacillus cereus]|nr:acyl-CoA thioesterase [Bacillus cereus]